MTYTKEKIDLFDKILKYYFEHHINRTENKNPTPTLFSKMFNIDTETAIYRDDEVLKNGKELGVLNAKKMGYGKYYLVKMHKIQTEYFINQGGFKKYFEEKNNDKNNPSKIHIGDIISNVNQLNKNEINNSSDFVLKPGYSKNKPNKFNTILTIIGIIIAIIGVYFAYLQVK